MKKFVLYDATGEKPRHLGNAFTPEGVASLCPVNIPIVNIRAMCELAVENDGYPYEIASTVDTGLREAGTGEPYTTLRWIGRIEYREPTVEES